ncbi:hypothetical protein psal_cds_1165 [Pandoravirus salinus]|uniref:Uncharacterized protein n=1 Tax=Pandoravirus salinus TaxID=1349410 RepID=S4VYK1_9VIRU|nr:hypothetical protein psal_cds_1165 [Pandoravirus salinus]AGO85438.1 hypothetical protein psal_cds_1165 [Pandoravirus salinus]
MKVADTGHADIGQTADTVAAATETIASAQKEAALADAALACVAWDESVDVGRLFLLEHEHDVGLLRHIVARAGARLDEYEEDRSFEFINDARVMNLNIFFNADSLFYPEYARVRRHDGAVWSVQDDDRRMTDAQATSWLAVCARHCLFALEYDVPRTVEEVDSDHPDRDDTHKVEDHETTWLASVVRGLAGRSGAWTGAEIMRTRNLSLVLLAILDARAKGGPLAVVDLPGGSRVDQGVVPSPADRREGDDKLLASMGDALAQVEHVRQAGFAFYVARAGRGLCGPAAHTRRALSMVCAGVDRLYATESFYLGVIAPAEYEAMAANGPLGATFFHQR